jgi:hypothetical protein
MKTCLSPKPRLNPKKRNLTLGVAFKGMLKKQRSIKRSGKSKKTNLKKSLKRISTLKKLSKTPGSVSRKRL